MPWKAMYGHGCSGATPWALVKTITGEKVSCHASKAKAQAQAALLYAKEGQMSAASADCGCDHDHAERAVDNTAWDGNAAMSACSDAACYRAICAGRKTGPAGERGSWALPHHKRPGSPPNAAAVRNALARLPQTQGLTNREQARRHLEAHMSSVSAGANSAEPPRADLFRALQPGYELRDDGAGGMPTLFGHFAVFNEWAEIDSLFEGRFLERLDPAVMDRTFKEDRDGMRVLFQHGRDPQIGDKPLGPIEVLEAQRTKGAYYEVPLIDTSYNRDLLLPGLRAELYGASFRFQVNEDHWVKKPERSKHNPEGLPERTIVDMTVREFGPVTFPAYAKATAGVRSLTDLFIMPASEEDRARLHDLLHDFTGRPDARSAGGGDPAAPTTPGNGEVAAITHLQRADHDALRLRGILS